MWVAAEAKPDTSVASELDYSLLANGLDFIESAVGHLSGTPTARELKYATLHLSAGIELVLKERLRREHWTLVFSKPEAAKLSAYASGDFSSVRLDDTFERLENVCGIALTQDERKRLTSLRGKRNRLEHFGIRESAEAFKASSAYALSAVIDFIVAHLQPQHFCPEDAEMLERIRQQLGEFSQFVVKRWNEIRSQICDRAAVRCPCCREEAFVVGADGRCEFCRYSDSPEVVAANYVSEILGWSWLGALGPDPPIHYCPECECYALVDRSQIGEAFSPSERYSYVCFGCGNTWARGALEVCGHCAGLRPVGDYSGICDSCMAQVMQEDFQHSMGTDEDVGHLGAEPSSA